jgi:hypothetical protein
MRPLFIPLRTRYFRAFESGAKTVELRRYGSRWNERRCVPGRQVVLSHGYSGARLYGRLVRFSATLMTSDIYGDCVHAVIEIALDQVPNADHPQIGTASVRALG